jgi:hypothetical protein
MWNEKKFYVKQINFNSYITTLATRPGSPIGKVISLWKCNPGRRGNGSYKTPPRQPRPAQPMPRPPRPQRRRTMPRPLTPLPTPLDDDIVRLNYIQIKITHNIHNK